MKIIDVVKTAISNSFRSKARTTLTVIAIFIGAFTLTITSALGTGISNYIDNQVASIGATDVLSIGKAAESTAAADDGPSEYDPNKPTAGGFFPGPPGSGTSSNVLTDADLNVIGATAGILDVSPVVTISPSYIQYDGHGKYELGVNSTAAITRADLAAGSQLTATGTENEILLPSSYLANLGFDDAEQAIGETVTIGMLDYQREMHEVEASVVGVQNASLFGDGAALGQRLSDELDGISAIGEPAGAGVSYFRATAHIDPDASQQHVDVIKADLADQGYSALTVADQIGTIQTVINGIIGVLNAFAVIALIAAGFGIVNTLLMSVQERTREIGLMKAMGMSGGKIYALFSAEAVFIGFLGSAVGALVAMGVGSLISTVLADTLLSDLQGLQVLQFAPASVGGIILIVMTIAFLAGTLPARRASRQNPIDALRYE